jgi:DNA-binding NtrC family response regulator
MSRRNESMTEVFVSGDQDRASFKPSLNRVVKTLKDEGLSYQEAVHLFEASYIGHVLKQQAGHRGKTAEQLGIHHNTLTRRLRFLQNRQERPSSPREFRLR